MDRQTKKARHQASDLVKTAGNSPSDTYERPISRLSVEDMAKDRFVTRLEEELGGKRKA